MNDGAFCDQCGNWFTWDDIATTDEGVFCVRCAANLPGDFDPWEDEVI